MKRSIVLVAAIAPVALAFALAAAAPAGAHVAASVHSAAAQTDNCHDPGNWQDEPTSTVQYWYATAPFQTNESVTDSRTSGSVDWCQATGATHGSITYVMFRAEGSSECATYDGAAEGTPGGTGSVDLQPCDSSVEAQNWYVGNFPPSGGNELYTYYQTANSVTGTCLSAANSSSNTPLVMVDNCNGDGGQSWAFGS